MNWSSSIDSQSWEDSGMSLESDSDVERSGTGSNACFSSSVQSVTEMMCRRSIEMGDDIPVGLGVNYDEELT